MISLNVTGSRRTNVSTGPEESTFGVILVSCGGAKPTQSSTNFFSCEKDPFYLHNGPGQKVLNYTQKPLAVMKWLVQLFSCEGDWVLDGLSGTGMLLGGACIEYHYSNRFVL